MELDTETEMAGSLAVWQACKTSFLAMSLCQILGLSENYLLSVFSWCLPRWCLRCHKQRIHSNKAPEGIGLVTCIIYDIIQSGKYLHRKKGRITNRQSQLKGHLLAFYGHFIPLKVHRLIEFFWPLASRKWPAFQLRIPDFK